MSNEREKLINEMYLSEGFLYAYNNRPDDFRCEFSTDTDYGAGPFERPTGDFVTKKTPVNEHVLAIFIDALLDRISDISNQIGNHRTFN